MKELKNVLVVDDDDEYNFLTEDAFCEAGLACKRVYKERAAVALELLDKGEIPDLIFLDINMPLMDGWEFLVEYENRGYHEKYDTVIIMTSSSCYMEDRIKALSFAKVVEYREKPLTCEAIYEIQGNFFSAQ